MKECSVEGCSEESSGRCGLCRPHKSEYNRAWYQKNKAKHKTDVRRNAERYKARFDSLVRLYKSTGCADCGEVYPPYVMDFDHLEDTEKVSNVASMAGWSLEKVEAEIAKCEVVCANCHRVRTHDRRAKAT
jgi:hypothetical protein